MLTAYAFGRAVILCRKPSDLKLSRQRDNDKVIIFICRLVILCCSMGGFVAILYKWKLIFSVQSICSQTVTSFTPLVHRQTCYVYICCRMFSAYMVNVGIYTTRQNCSKIKFQHVFSWLNASLKIYLYMYKIKKKRY